MPGLVRANKAQKGCLKGLPFRIGRYELMYFTSDGWIRQKRNCDASIIDQNSKVEGE